MSTRWGTVLLLALLGAWSRPAAAKTKYYGIVIGNNAAPARSEGAPHAPLSTLKFADDDAASMTAFLAEFGAETRLLTVMDADTQRRYPELVARARPPSLVELRRAIAEYAVSVARDERAGDESVLVFFFSGHGVDDVGERSFLSLLDAPLTQALLYDEILPHLPGRAVHLIVDACHAEAVVRPRDLNVGMGDVTEDDRARYRARWTLDRFPHVGAVIASNVSAQAQEWDRYRQGVFTHEVLSGLRGAADVNGDGRVEYSELEAFLAAANRSVRDDRARPSVLVRVPAIDARAPLVNLAESNAARLRDPAGELGRVFIEDEFGTPILEMFGENGFSPEVAVPPGHRLFVRSAQGDLSLVPQAGERVSLHAADFRQSTLAARGSLDASLLEGLFAIPFGPVYYRGYVDARADLIPVSFERPVDSNAATDHGHARTIAEPIAFGSAGLLLGVATGFTIDALSSAHTYNHTTLERQAAESKTRFERDRVIAVATGAVGLAAAGLGTWLELRHSQTTLAIAPGPQGAAFMLRHAF